MKKRYIFMIIFIILLILLDQVSKVIVSSKFAESTILIKNIISIEKSGNQGFYLGLNKENIQNIILSIFVIIIIIKYLIKHEKYINKLVIVCMSMIIAGGVSNIIDRIFRGDVFDFIKLGINFPIFNFADIFIFIGWIIYMVYLLIFAFRTV